jgi:hypothetical protein
MNKKQVRCSPRVIFYGPPSPETVIASMDGFISWEAFAFADSVAHPFDNQQAQDLAQEAWFFVFRQLQRSPDIWSRKLERLTYLRMKNVLQRGRSVLRADPGTRKRTYERVSLSSASMDNICTSSLSFEEEYDILLNALQRARDVGDREAEHRAILLLRRFARRICNDDLFATYTASLRVWWQQTRLLEAQV